MIPGLILPPGVMGPPPAGTPGNPIVYRCMCGQTYPLAHRHSFDLHISKCAVERLEANRAHTLSSALPELFGPEAGDVEQKKWVKQHKDALIRGDMKQ